MTAEWEPNETERKLIDLGMVDVARDQYWLRHIRNHPGSAERLNEIRTIAEKRRGPMATMSAFLEANYFLTVVALLEGREPPPKRPFGARIP